MSIEAMKQALEALEESVDLVRHAYETDWRHGMPTRKAQLEGLKCGVEAHEQAITSIRQAIAEESSATQEPACCSGKCPNKKECESAMQCLYNHPQPKEDLQAELEATDRQVEILSDALTESRREVAALKAAQPKEKQEPKREPLTGLKEALIEAMSIINHYGMHGWSKAAHDEGERVMKNARKALAAHGIKGEA